MIRSDPTALEPANTASSPRCVCEAALVVFLALILNLAGNGQISLWDRDEPRYAGCTREMRSSGDWIHPTFNAEPRYHKPILIYWLMLAGTALGGDNPFGARLVSALAGAGTCLLIWSMGRRMFGPQVGRLAGLMLATAPIVVAESKLATTDATLMLLVVGCQFALWELGQRPSRLAAAVFWVLMALSILTKAPAGPVLIGVAGVASWWWGGPTACWRRLHWRWGPLLCLLITAPWFVVIMLSSRGEYYNVAVGYHVITRATRGIEQHAGFFGYYVVLSLGIFYPWSALMPPALYGAWARRKQAPAFGFLLGWIVGPLVLLELVRTKLIHYYLPSYPPCALVVSWMIAAAAESETRLRRWPLGRIGLGILVGTGVGGAIALLGVACVVPVAVGRPVLVLAAVVAAAAIIGWRLYVRGAPERATNGLIAAFALTGILVGGWLLPVAEPFRVASKVGRRLAELEARERIPAALSSYDLPGVIYALGHPAPLARSLNELRGQLGREGQVVIALLPDELKVLQKETWLAVEVRETVRGFNIDKGRMETLHLAVIHSHELISGRQSQAASIK